MRRVVVANVEGVSRVVEDGAPPRSRRAVHTPGLSNTLLWCTAPGAGTAYDRSDPTVAAQTFVPPPGGTSQLLLVLPPMSVYQQPGYDRGAASAEHVLISPGIADHMESDNPGMHTTPTIDYDFVIEGRLTLELTDGEVDLEAGDVVVQLGTRHAWRNRSDRIARLLVVFIGAATKIA